MAIYHNTLGMILSQLFECLSVMFGIKKTEYTAFAPAYYLDNKVIFIFIVSVLACLPWKQYFSEFAAKHTENAAVKTALSIPVPVIEIVKRVLLLCMLVLSFMYIVNSTYNPFIYFRF